MERMDILDHEQIHTKLRRIACEIAEKHTDSKALMICGMNSRGFFLAGELQKHIHSFLPKLKIEVIQAREGEKGLEFNPHPAFAGRHMLVIDDVINTGRTLMQAIHAIFAERPETIETAFLAKREHRNFPVKADYVGISLATTLSEHVYFDNSNAGKLKVYLQ